MVLAFSSTVLLALLLPFDGTVSGVQGCITCVKEGDMYHGVLRTHPTIAGVDPTRTNGGRDPQVRVRVFFDVTRIDADAGWLYYAVIRVL